MSTVADDLAVLRAKAHALELEVHALKASALPVEQRQAVERLSELVEDLVRLVEADKMRRLFLGSVRSWAVAIAAVIAAFWVIRDGAARVIRTILGE